MVQSSARSVGILWRGGRRADAAATPFGQRLRPVFDALEAADVGVEAVVFDDDVVAEVRAQLLGLDGVLVWVDPVMGERTRVVLDALLRDVASEGVWVSAHPDVIEKMGTKELLVRTRDLPFGSDTHLYRTFEEFRASFPDRLSGDGPRVLKPFKGNAGIGVWKIGIGANETVEIQDAHPRGTDVETMPMAEFMRRWESNFAGGRGGGLVDQPFQPRIADGMIRCYMVRGEVAGFAHQEPDADQLASGRVFGLPSKKTMFEASEPRFASLRTTVETTWLPAMLAAVGVAPGDLPFLWDADFMYGPKSDAGEDTYVLCEINVSSVIPFPPAAPGMIAVAVADRLSKEK